VALPSGARVRIPCGALIVLGREANVPEIREALEPFDTVSRRHCYFTVDASGTQIAVRDAGSVNGTWTADEPTEVPADEWRFAALPARIRLGRHLSVGVSGEEAT
jgi:pSer/pThr/pTyr-binding forkhead associated (FHA) protein